MTSSKIYCSSPGPLTSLGLVHILTTPLPPIVFLGMAPTLLFTSSDHATRRTDPLAQSLRLYLSLRARWMRKGSPDTLLAGKASSRLYNPKHLRRNSPSPLLHFPQETGFPLLCRVSSPPASQDIYCCCHNDLIEAKEPFVGLELFALQIRAPCARMTAPYARISRSASTH